MANFSVATDEGYRDRQTGQRVERTEWHRVVAWRQTGRIRAATTSSKGRLVMVEGKLQTRKWQGQDGQDRYTTEIVADSIQGLDRAPEGQQARFSRAGISSRVAISSRADIQQQGGGYQQNQQPQQNNQQQNGYPQNQPQQQEEDLGPAFPSEASGMDDVPF